MARDLCDVVGSVVLGEALVSSAHVEALQETGREVLLRVRERLGSVLNAVGGPPAKHRDGIGVFLQRSEFELWIIVTPHGGHYNAFGSPDSVGIRLTEAGEKPFRDEPRVLAGGFERVRTRGGPHDVIYLELETVDGVINDADTVADQVADKALAALQACRPPLI